MMLSISLDDGYDSWFDAGSILKHYGYRATFNTVLRNVVHKRVKTRPKMFPTKNVVLWGELYALDADGHDIESHGTRHVDLPECTPSELWMEVVASKNVFNSMGFDVHSYACAFNSCTQKVQKYALKHYPVFRGGAGINEYPPEKPVYHAMDGTKALTYVEENKDKDEWVVGIWHDVDPFKFERTVNAISKMGVKVVSVREAYGR